MLVLREQRHGENSSRDVWEKLCTAWISQYWKCFSRGHHPKVCMRAKMHGDSKSHFNKLEGGTYSNFLTCVGWRPRYIPAVNDKRDAAKHGAWWQNGRSLTLQLLQQSHWGLCWPGVIWSNWVLPFYHILYHSTPTLHFFGYLQDTPDKSSYQPFEMHICRSTNNSLVRWNGPI